MLTTIAELLNSFNTGKITKKEWVHKHDPLCTGCEGPLEQLRIPLAERYILSPQPDKCSDCYERALMNYIATRKNGLRGIFSRNPQV